MFKDFGLILRLASELAAPMPATAAAHQAYAIAQARGVEDDVAAIIAVMEDLASPMLAMAAAQQPSTTAQTKDEDDAATIIAAIEELAGLSEH